MVVFFATPTPFDREIACGCYGLGYPLEGKI